MPVCPQRGQTGTLWGPPHPKICHLGAIKGAVTQTQLPGLSEGTETPLQLLQGQMGGSGMDNVGDTMQGM